MPVTTRLHLGSVMAPVPSLLRTRSFLDIFPIACVLNEKLLKMRMRNGWSSDNGRWRDRLFQDFFWAIQIELFVGRSVDSPASKCCPVNNPFWAPLQFYRNEISLRDTQSIEVAYCLCCIGSACSVNTRSMCTVVSQLCLHAIHCTNAIEYGAYCPGL